MKQHVLSAGWRVPVCAALLFGTTLSQAAYAAPADDIAELKAAVAALRADQARAQARIAELENALAARRETPVAVAAAAPPAAPHVAAAAPVGAAFPRLTLSGDMRMRYESNFGVAGARNRDRGVFRARLRAAYAVNDWLTVGGQIATGDPDDPNSTDMTLSNFDDDLHLSLDQAYIRLAPANLQVHLGKIPQPFVRTELVWDGDVSPQGASAAYSADLGGMTLKASGLYFMVDESVAGPDSRMIGGQLSVQTAPAPIQAELAVGYYDYALRSIAGADAGDVRSNLFAGGRYLSDFNLLDVIAALTWNGLGEKWPVRLVGDYVHNYGAATDADTGFGVDLLVGRANKPGDWRFTYGYAEAETDAVLAAFSHDNTNLATNYMQHTLAVDFVPQHKLVLNATYYRYRQKDVALGPIDWQNRMRLNVLVNF